MDYYQNIPKSWPMHPLCIITLSCLKSILQGYVLPMCQCVTNELHPLARFGHKLMLFMYTIPTMPCYWDLEVIKNLGHFHSFPSAQLTNGCLVNRKRLLTSIPIWWSEASSCKCIACCLAQKSNFAKLLASLTEETKDLVKGSNEFIATSWLNRLDVTSKSFWTTISGEVTSCRCNFVQFLYGDGLPVQDKRTKVLSRLSSLLQNRAPVPVQSSALNRPCRPCPLFVFSRGLRRCN